MNSYHQIRDDLMALRRVLMRRVQEIEHDLDLWRDGERGGPLVEVESETELESAIEEVRRELGLITSSLRRIADRTFDCCIRCGATIPEELLRLSPYAANCEDCSREFGLDYFRRIRVHHADLKALLEDDARARAAGEVPSGPSRWTRVKVSRKSEDGVASAGAEASAFGPAPYSRER